MNYLVHKEKFKKPKLKLFGYFRIISDIIETARPWIERKDEIYLYDLEKRLSNLLEFWEIFRN